MAELYSCDTSVLIRAWMKDYRPKTFPQVWKKIEKLIGDGIIIAVEDVYNDLKQKEGDSLFAWAKARRDSFFIPMDDPIQEALRAILKDHRRLIEHRPGKSASDPIVIALAMVRGGTVLTDENMSGSMKKPKIPDVCKAMSIDCCNLADLFDRHNFVF